MILSTKNQLILTILISVRRIERILFDFFGSGSGDEEMEDEEQTTKKSTGKYVIPKNRQAFYDEPGTDKAEERRKKKAIRGAIADELMKDTDEPEEINTGELHQSGKMSAR